MPNSQEVHCRCKFRRFGVQFDRARRLQKEGIAGRAAGARDYRVNGVLTSGVAFLAYPAVYPTSGVMTFVINQDGRAFQKDLGPETATVATAMSEYNPDKTWTPAG